MFNSGVSLLDRNQLYLAAAFVFNRRMKVLNVLESSGKRGRTR